MRFLHFAEHEEAKCNAPICFSSLGWPIWICICSVRLLHYQRNRQVCVLRYGTTQSLWPWSQQENELYIFKLEVQASIWWRRSIEVRWRCIYQMNSNWIVFMVHIGLEAIKIWKCSTKDVLIWDVTMSGKSQIVRWQKVWDVTKSKMSQIIDDKKSEMSQKSEISQN